MAQVKTALSPVRQTQVDRVFKALSAEPRRAIIRTLASANEAGGACCADADVCACRFAEVLGLSASTISHHMSVLTDAGLVTGRKEGTWVYYRLERAALDAALESLTGPDGSIRRGKCS